jgi:hypothetical protein
MVLDILMESDPNIRFNVQHGMWTTGVNTSYELIQGTKNYTINISKKLHQVYRRRRRRGTLPGRCSSFI